MAAIRQLRRESLSVSLPDVSIEGTSFDGSNHEFTPLPPLPASPPANYNIDDDRWADKMDSVTGSVLFIDTHSGHAPFLRSYSSCSSLSSLTSDLPYAPSPTHSLHSENFADRFSRSLQLSPRSFSVDYDHASLELNPSEEVIRQPETVTLSSKKTSSLKRIKKVFKRKKLSGSGSLSDLNEMASQTHIQSLPSFSEREITPTSPVPETTLFGSMGIPLTPTHYGRGQRGSTLTRVSLDISQFGLGMGGSPCSLDRLGIVPSRSLAKNKFGSTFSLKFPKSPSTPELSQPVLIRGVVPGSPAAVSQLFYSGDTIHFVGNNRVTLNTIDSVLGGLSGQVIFLIKKGYQRSRSSLSRSSPAAGGLVKLVSGVREVVRSHSQQSHPHTSLVLYLTLDTKEDDPPGKDILYQWPHGEEGCGDPLLAVRGLFLTLADLLSQITSSKSFCSTVTVDGRLVHLSYIKYGQELLLLTLPAHLATAHQAQLFVEKLAATLELLYGTVHDAFTASPAQWSLDHLLALFIDSLTTPPSDGSARHLLTAVPQLKLPVDLRVRLSSRLSGLDSGDHSNRPEILDQRRPFTVLGSCLFYKGSLVCSHLNKSDQCDVVRLCDAYRLPELTATHSISQIVIWKQVHLSRLRAPADSSKPARPLDQRQFALVVGLESVFVCLLMEATTPFPPHTPPTVDAVYVDRSRSLILELLRSHDITECQEKGLPSAPLPSVTTVDIALASKFTRHSSLSLASLPPTAPLRRRKTSEPSNSIPTIRLVGESSDSDDPSFRASPSTHRRSQSLLSPKTTKHSTSLLETSRWSKMAMARDPYMLTSGTSNLLLHYVHLNQGRGALLCPAYSQPFGPVHSELLHTFRETTLTLRQALWGRVEVGVASVESDSDSEDWDDDEEIKTEKGKIIPPFAPQATFVLEQGVLIQCGIQGPEKHKSSPTLNYWVIGRLFGEGEKRTELYVCYQENMGQDCVEMAYRLLFGWTC